MKIEITTKNYVLPEKLRDIISKKIGRFDKYFPDDTRTKVVVKKEGSNYKMEISTALQNTYVRSELVSDNPYDAIDILIPKIEKQILKYKSKLEEKLKSFDNADIDVEIPEIPPFKISKTKFFNLIPMHVEDAAMEMDLSSHDFYVFLDEESEKISVIYRRGDGTYGLLVPNNQM